MFVKNVQEEGSSYPGHESYRAHIAAPTSRYLNAHNIEITGHSRYTPDLTPNDFLFPRVASSQ